MGREWVFSRDEDVDLYRDACSIVNQFVRKGVSVMPFFRKTEISGAELDALAAFLSKQK